MGGKGSGSRPGNHANNFKDGRWLYRERVKGEARGGRVVGHVKPPARDRWGNITGPNRPELHKASNLRVVSKSDNARGSTNRVQRRPKGT